MSFAFEDRDRTEIDVLPSASDDIVDAAWDNGERIYFSVPTFRRNSLTLSQGWVSMLSSG